APQKGDDAFVSCPSASIPLPVYSEAPGRRLERSGWAAEPPRCDACSHTPALTTFTPGRAHIFGRETHSPASRHRLIRRVLSAAPGGDEGERRAVGPSPRGLPTCADRHAQSVSPPRAHAV